MVWGQVFRPTGIKIPVFCLMSMTDLICDRVLDSRVFRGLLDVAPGFRDNCRYQTFSHNMVFHANLISCDFKRTVSENLDFHPIFHTFPLR